MSKELDKLADAVYKCIRCGSCRAVCPTFGEELTETSVARGRVALVEAVIEGKLPMTPLFEKTVFDCAMCGACKANCPAGVDIPAVVEAAREVLAREKGSEGLMRYMARKSLKDKGAMDRAFGLMRLGGAVYGPLTGTPLSKFLPYQEGGKKRSFPKIPARPLAKRVPNLSPVDRPKGKVAFYAGCVINYVYPEVGEALVRVVNRAGYDVQLVKGELCCGKPLKSLGEAEAFKELAEKTAAQLAEMDVDRVLTACPTCALTLKEDYSKILTDRAAAERLSGKIEDVNRFLLEKSDILGQLGHVELSATYHDPCHLNFGMGIKSEPRALIRASAGGGLIEMAESERCCGFGGSFSFLNYCLSGKISGRKAANIGATGADTVVTACPGCMMHIQDAVKQSGDVMTTLHTIQLVDMALGRSR